MSITEHIATARRPSIVRYRTLGLGATAAAAAAGFGALTVATARHATRKGDRLVHRKTAAPRGHPVRRAAKQIAPVGKWYAYVPAALALAGYVLAARRDDDRAGARAAGAGAIALAGGLAALLAPACDRWLPQRRAPPGHRNARKPVFPSGHAFGPGAVALTAAYVLAREGFARPSVAFPAALAVPLVTATGKILEEKHWVSDVAGGYLAALAVAGGCLAGYESLRDG